MKFYDFTEYGNSDCLPLNDKSLYRDFICCYIKDFDDTFKEQKNSVTKNKLQNDNINRIVQYLLSIEPDIVELLKTGEIPDCIFFRGGQSWDGHGILVNERSFVFFNMDMIDEHFKYENFNMKAHAIHELFHAIHYKARPDFYQGNYKTTREFYLNKMIAEGVASYLSKKVVFCDEIDALTFGFMDKKEFLMWKTKCCQFKNTFRNEMKNVVTNETIDKENIKDLYYQLYFVPDPDEGAMTRGRFGYLYGYEIVKNITEKLSLNELLNLSPENYYSYINGYFSDIYTISRFMHPLS
jgi:hypothetical protein